MSERDELLKVMLDADEAHAPEGSMWPELADAILAAGYRKPRTIDTVKELDALPRFTVIRSDEGAVFERQTMWHEAGSRDLMYSPDIALPATVLQLGWGEE